MSQPKTGKGRPSPRVARKHEQVRQEILAAAQSLLQGGPEAVTLASVAGELGMTKQALYHYYASKEALLRAMVTTLLDVEIETLIEAVEAVDSGKDTLSTLIRAFYNHYINHLDAFRSVYCQSQLYRGPDSPIDEDTIRDEINPRTRHLFDILEARIAASSKSKRQREKLRQLAFTAWLSALGLMTMLGVAEALDDPLIHSDEDLLSTLSDVFDSAAKGHS